MATLKICDWTKKRLDKDEKIILIAIEDREFEVGTEGHKLLLGQLEGEDAPGTPQIKVVERVVHRDPDPNLVLEPASTTLAPVNSVDANPDNLLEIPDDPKKRLRTPSKLLAQRVVEEATKFQEGTLPALTVGNQQQRDAAKRLKAQEDKQEESLRRKGGRDFNVNQSSQNPGH